MYRKSALDTRTILIAAALTILANGGVFILIQRRLPSTDVAAAKAWQLGTLLIAAGCIVFFVKTGLPRELELTVPNALIMLGLAMYWCSTRLLCGLSAALAPALAPVLIATAGVYVFHIHYPDPWIRILLVAIAWTALMFGSATTLLMNMGQDARGSQRAMAWLFYVVGFCTVLRLLYYSQLDLSVDFDATDNRYWVTRLTPLLALALPVLGSTIFALLCYDRARCRARRQTEALGYISHDLRAPAATIKGYVDLLRPVIPSGHASHLSAIQRSTDYQISLIDELLEYAAQDLKPLDIHPGPLDMQAFIEGLAEQGRALCRQHGNHFAIEAGSPLPVRVWADGRRLSQVLLNLIANAAAFTRRGKVVLALASAPQGKHAALDFAVQDNGPGISANRQAGVFGAFQQDHRRQGSVGLGLHIARNIVQNMDAELRLDSAPGRGARFSFQVVVPALSAETFQPACEPRVVPEAAEGAPVAAPLSIQPFLRDLAQYAKSGEITRIEQWLAEHLRLYPDAAAFLRQIERAVAQLDLACIERLASAAAVEEQPEAP